MSYLSLEEKRVSEESERRGMLCAWRCVGISKNSPGCCVVQHLRGEKRGMRFIFTNISVLHTSCLHLQVKKSLTFKDSPEPPLLYETVRAPRLLGRGSGLSTALWWGLLSVLPAENELLKDRFYSLSLVIKMSNKYWMNLSMNPRRNDANIIFYLHHGPLESGYSRNPGLLLKRI